MKRILDCHASDFAAMSGRELLAAIAGSEGRTIACETIGALMPMLGDITNAEFAAAMGADILLLNLFDVQHPIIRALPECAPEDTVRKLKALTGRPVGINLEPIDEEIAGQREGMWAMTDGRVATLENARRASDMGVDMILLTGNPGMGVKNAAIERTLRLYRRELGEKSSSPRARCTPRACWARARRTSSPARTCAPLSRPARTSSSCRPRARCRASRWRPSGSW